MKREEVPDGKRRATQEGATDSWAPHGANGSKPKGKEQSSHSGQSLANYGRGHGSYYIISAVIGPMCVAKPKGATRVG